MSFPETFIRGIRRASDVTPEGGVKAGAFEPYTPEPRQDKAEEISINWEDDEDVLPFTFQQRDKNGNYAFQAGAVRVRRDVIDWINRNPVTKDTLAYERKPLIENVYHGNILIVNPQPSRQTIRLIQATLAGSASHLEKRS